MTTEFKLPDLGENIESGDVVKLLVSVGDSIEADQPVLELETDKATVEVPSSVGGVVKEILLKEGDQVTVGQVVLTVEAAAAETTADQAPPSSEAEPEPVPQAEEEKVDETESIETQQAETVEQTTEPSPSAPVMTEFKLPDLGENIEAGDVTNVLVSVGDEIEANQPVLELETDKATVEVPSTVGGIVKDIHVEAGERASVGQLILTVETSTLDVAPAPPEKTPEPMPKVDEPEPVPGIEKAQEQIERPSRPASSTVDWRTMVDILGQPDPTRSAVQAAPNVRRLAREIGIDITQVQGTGPLGRISMEDVKRQARQLHRAGGAARLAAPAPGVTPAPGPSMTQPDFEKWGEVTREQMSNVRRSTATHLSGAWATIPHVTQFDRADIVELEQLRQRFSKKAEEAGGKLTVTAILLKVMAAALKQFPKFNASLDLANSEIVYKHYYHLGLAVDTERGLLVPVIRDVNQKNILELAAELTEVSEKARSRKLGLEDMQGGTFTITNLGGIGGTYFTPIVNSPEVAILGVARGRLEPVYQNGQFEPRLMLPLALSYDHRLIDGADAARFLRWVVEALEDPILLSLQGW